MQYRRITEVLEDGEERQPIPSGNAEKVKTNSNDRRLFSGPKTPAEADPADEDISDFKRVQIVAPPNFTEPDIAGTANASAGTLSASRQRSGSSGERSGSDGQRTLSPSRHGSMSSSRIHRLDDHVESLPVSVKVKMHDDRRRVTLRRLTLEEAPMSRQASLIDASLISLSSGEVSYD